MGLSNSEADCIGETLTKWASCNLDTFCVMGFRMARSDTINTLPKSSVLEILLIYDSCALLGKLSDHP